MCVQLTRDRGDENVVIMSSGDYSFFMFVMKYGKQNGLTKLIPSRTLYSWNSYLG